MIIVKNRKLLIPETDRYIGTTIDNNASQIQFQLDRYTQTEIDLSDLTAKAVITYEGGTTDVADLTCETSDSTIILTMTLVSTMMSHAGTMLLSLKMFDPSGTVRWGSFQGAFYIEESAEAVAPASALTELEQLESRVDVAVQQSGEKAKEVAEEWLDERIVEGLAIDKTLTISGAAADAKVTGERIASAGKVSDFNGRTGSIVPQTSDYAGKYVDSFNGRTGAVTPQTSDYAGKYVDSFNGRTGAVTPASGDYSAGQISRGTSNVLEDLIHISYPNAGSHNSIYRGKYLGDSLTAAQSAAIRAGTFDDLYIGDYWTINGVNWRIADFDYWYMTGDTACTTHHVVVVPDSVLYTAQMNTSNITTGAYVGSAMYTSNLAEAKSTANTAFGSGHVLSHRILLQNATTNGYPSGQSWYDSTVDLMTESMVYGGPHLAPMVTISGSSPIVPSNYTVENRQLKLFALDPQRLVANRNWWWLRDVVNAAYFAYVGTHGNCTCNAASNSYGVRPAIAIY